MYWPRLESTVIILLHSATHHLSALIILSAAQWSTQWRKLNSSSEQFSPSKRTSPFSTRRLHLLKVAPRLLHSFVLPQFSLIATCGSTKSSSSYSSSSPSSTSSSASSGLSSSTSSSLPDDSIS